MYKCTDTQQLCGIHHVNKCADTRQLHSIHHVYKCTDTRQLCSGPQAETSEPPGRNERTIRRHKRGPDAAAGAGVGIRYFGVSTAVQLCHFVGAKTHRDTNTSEAIRIEITRFKVQVQIILAQGPRFSDVLSQVMVGFHRSRLSQQPHFHRIEALKTPRTLIA